MRALIPARAVWRLVTVLLLVLPLVLLLNALLMLRELERARVSFLRSKAAEVAARLELSDAEAVAEDEPALAGLSTYGPGDAEREPAVGRLLGGLELFRTEDGPGGRFRVWVPYHARSGPRVARLDLNPNAADFLTAGPRRNLYLSMAVALVMAGLTGYALWANRRHERMARLAELGQMSGVLAHEIRNPLGALKGFLQLALERSSDESRAWLQTSLEQTGRLERLVKDLLLYARAPQPRLQTISWHQMRDRLRPHAPGVVCQGDDFRLLTDPDLLEQALLNLLRNACEAGTEVRLDAAPGRIRVTDDGPGVPAEVRRKLFQPFVTTKAQGTGLGLAIVRNLTHALGCEVELIDLKPSGTCAEIRWSAKA